jgi:hypothetical protein
MNRTKHSASALPENAAENSPITDQSAESHDGPAPASNRVKTGLIAFEGDLQPVDYLLSVMRDATASNSRRDKAATSVLPYVHPRVSPIAPVVEQDTAAQRRMKEASDSLIQTMAEFRTEFDPDFRKPTDGSAT